MKWVLLLPPFYPWENQGTEILSNLRERESCDSKLGIRAPDPRLLATIPRWLDCYNSPLFLSRVCSFSSPTTSHGHVIVLPTAPSLIHFSLATSTLFFQDRFKVYTSYKAAFLTNFTPSEQVLPPCHFVLLSSFAYTFPWTPTPL